MITPNQFNDGSDSDRIEAPVKDAVIQHLRGYDGCMTMLHRTGPEVTCENVLFEGRPLDMMEAEGEQ